MEKIMQTPYVDKMLVELFQIFAQAYPVWRSFNMKNGAIGIADYNGYAKMFTYNPEINLDDVQKVHDWLLCNADRYGYIKAPPTPIEMRLILRNIHHAGKPMATPIPHAGDEDLKSPDERPKNFDHHVTRYILLGTKNMPPEAHYLLPTIEKYHALKEEKPDFVRSVWALMRKYWDFMDNFRNKYGNSLNYKEILSKFLTKSQGLKKEAVTFGGWENIKQMLETARDLLIWPELKNLVFTLDGERINIMPLDASMRATASTANSSEMPTGTTG